MGPDGKVSQAAAHPAPPFPVRADDAPSDRLCHFLQARRRIRVFAQIDGQLLDKSIKRNRLQDRVNQGVWPLWHRQPVSPAHSGLHDKHIGAGASQPGFRRQ